MVRPAWTAPQPLKADSTALKIIRRTGKPTWVVWDKIDLMDQPRGPIAAGEFPDEPIIIGQGGSHVKRDRSSGAARDRASLPAASIPGIARQGLAELAIGNCEIWG